MLAVAQANAQSAAVAATTGTPAFSAAAESSSLEMADAALPANPAALPAAPSARAAGGGQVYGRRYKRQEWAFVAGGGFNAPVGNDLPFITWGGNFTIGAGLRFNEFASGLLEYQFIDDKLPGAFIAAASNANGGGITGGNAHIQSLTVSPVIDLSPKSSNGAYLVGGWGFYHKSTNFSAPEAVFDPFFGYYFTNVTVASFTSNQWGGNAGLGIYHRLGTGLHGETRPQLFAEARWTFIDTPPFTKPNGLGRTELIPVTVGVRF